MARSTMLLVATDDGVDPAYAACRRAGLEVARRAGAAVVLYDRSSESYLVDPYEPGPWTSQNHGPAGETLLNPNELVRLGAATSLIKSLRVARSGCRSALGWPTGPVRPP